MVVAIEAAERAREAARERPARLVYFGHDRTDSKVIQRLDGFARLDLDVLALTFRREKYNRDHRPRWRNVDLGTTVDYGYARRVVSVLKALGRAWCMRRELRAADGMIARNLDMAALAVGARWLSGARCPLAYEVLDVHRFLIGDGVLQRLFRWLERRVLARSALLIVSSPAYLREHFAPVQGYRGPSFLLENKVAAAHGLDRRRLPGRSPRPDGRWVIGWCGTLRCVRSLDLLVELARRHRERLVVYLRGFPTETGLDALLARIAGEPNMVYGGGYRSPEDLADVYGRIDLNWCLDYYDAGKNSEWLLPNRLYEGGFFNVPALGLAGTEVGRKIADEGLGWTVQEPAIEGVSRLLERLTPAAHAACVRRLAALPDAAFADTGDLVRLCRALLAQAPQPAEARAA